MRKALLALTAILVAGCGSAPVSLTSPTSTSTPRPTATPVLPSQATLEAALHFSPGQSNLGDPIENLDIDITSNVPVTFEVNVALYIDGQFRPDINNCGIDPIGYCIVEHGAAHLGTFYWPKHAPRGQYQLKLLAYSYSGTLSDGVSPIFQEHDYQNWVGPLGLRLRGNPLAVPDANHPAVLNLQRVVTFSH